MNIAVTSRDAILDTGRKMIMENGISSINMRAVAERCGTAVGSIYNYFPSKADLLAAAIESVWKDIFSAVEQPYDQHSFTDSISWLFHTIKNGEKKYPGFFSVHSLNFASEEKAKGRKMMEEYFEGLKGRLLSSLRADERVRKGAFDGVLSQEIFVDYVFTLLVSVLVQKKGDCQALLKMVENCIY